MYRQSSNLKDINKAVCPECKSTRFLYTKGKLVCTNCQHSIGGRMNKFGAKRTKARDGVVRDSKYEASVADELLLRKQVGDIKDYESQYKVEMWAYNKDGDPVMKKSHKVDFRIHHNDGSYELLEAKGVETSDYRDRRKWLETFWLPENKDHIYTVVKQNGRKR